MTAILNDQQATAILVESLSRGIYEPAVPTDEKQRLKDATDIVAAAQAAFNNGNKSDNVNTILFIAQTDLAPEIPVATHAQAPAETEIVDHIHNGLDLSTLTDGILEALITGLDAYPQTEKVEEDRKAYVAEKERRSNEPAQEIQEITPQAEASADEEKAGEITPASPTPADEGAGERAQATEGPNTGAVAPDGGAGGQTGNTDEDAGAFARAQTPETQPEGKVSKAPKVKEDGTRDAIISQLTLPAVKAHGVDITKLDSVPTEKLLYIVENPDGPKEESTKMPVNESEVEAGAISADRGGTSIGGIVAEVKAPETVVTKADLGLNVEEETTGDISAEREKIESLVTGPCLKAYGRGRKEIPSIGDNELRFMVLNPDGKVSPEELARAKAMDNPESVAAVKESQMAVTKEVPGPELVDHFLSDDQREEIILKEELPLTEITLPSGQKVKIALPESINTEAMISVPVQISPENNKEFSPENLAGPIRISEEEQKDRSIGQAAAESVSKPQPVQAPEVVSKPVTQSNFDKFFEAQTGVTVTDDKLSAQNRAMEIIQKENFPTPPNYSDENAPQFPIDVSLCSRDELFSLHARFHAYETRMNWVLMQHEDEMNDYIKMRTYREAVVAKEVPFMGEDNKRNTNEHREAQVRGDIEVLELGKKEHEARKVVTDLKVLRNNYHLDCERLSRQMSKYEMEKSDAPR